MRRTAAVAVVLALAVGCTPSGTSAHHAAPGATTRPAESLASLLAAITPPAGAAEVSTDPRTAISHQAAPQYGTGGPGYVQLNRYWIMTATTPKQAIAAVTAHAPYGLPLSPDGMGTQKGLTVDGVQYDANETAGLDGPHLYVEAEPFSSGQTVLAAHVWETVKQAKPASEMVSGTVSAVDASISVFGSTKPMHASVTGARAQQLAHDVNGLWVDVGMEDAGCGGSISTSTFFDLTFHASGGDRRLSTGCLTLSAAAPAPNLWESDALVADLQADFGTLLPAPLMTGGMGPSAPTPPQSAALAAMLDQLNPPTGAKQTALPADIEASVTGYSTQPGYAQAARAWTTTLSPDAAVAALSTHVPAGLQRMVERADTGYLLPHASASYGATDTATTLGPRLEVVADQDAAGITTIDALLWQIDKTAKPVRDQVTGSVESATGTYSGGRNTALTVTGTAAKQLAFDLNALLVNGSTLPPGCDTATAALTLSFRTQAGQQSFSDSCGFVRVLPAVAGDPELATSDAFNADVNAAFGSLVPSPLPSSAPLPTSPAQQTAGKSADEVIAQFPRRLTIEAVLPVSPGKQRETDQTFMLIGNTAVRIVDDLNSSRVDTGPAPAGCQPDMRTTTVRTSSPGRLQTFVVYCMNVTTTAPGDPRLTLPAALEKDLESYLAQLTPTRSVDPPADSTLALTISTSGTPKDTVPHPLSGTVTVSQDGVVIGTKHLAAKQTWHLRVRQGSYTISARSSGHTCQAATFAVPAHELMSPGPICS